MRSARYCSVFVRHEAWQWTGPVISPIGEQGDVLERQAQEGDRGGLL
jgi:hypothetical protein